MTRWFNLAEELTVRHCLRHCYQCCRRRLRCFPRVVCRCLQFISLVSFWYVKVKKLGPLISNFLRRKLFFGGGGVHSLLQIRPTGRGKFFPVQAMKVYGGVEV